MRTRYGFKISGDGASSGVVASATARVKADLGSGSASGIVEMHTIKQ